MQLIIYSFNYVFFFAVFTHHLLYHHGFKAQTIVFDNLINFTSYFFECSFSGWWVHFNLKCNHVFYFGGETPQHPVLFRHAVFDLTEVDFLWTLPRQKSCTRAPSSGARPTRPSSPRLCREELRVLPFPLHPNPPQPTPRPHFHKQKAWPQTSIFSCVNFIYTITVQ